ncbi:hypothetical protein HPB48_018856 [Haemaphysalis longicornis]|uniref:Uncharacterized protein n=1 Tax=Haemaphysalis longicornis TaxID=44386 RepID=A0A9J6GPS0_HAELO|nr:hypothetical protein HPB48_018856 [Haemaphysalis longicornis]
MSSSDNSDDLGDCPPSSYQRRCKPKQRGEWGIGEDTHREQKYKKRPNVNTSFSDPKATSDL